MVVLRRFDIRAVPAAAEKRPPLRWRAPHSNDAIPLARTHDFVSRHPLAHASRLGLAVDGSPPIVIAGPPACGV